MGESADVEEIEFFPDSMARKAKIRALIVHDKKMRFIVRSPQGDGLTPVIVQYTEVSVLTLRNVAVLGMNFISVYFLHCAIC